MPEIQPFAPGPMGYGGPPGAFGPGPGQGSFGYGAAAPAPQRAPAVAMGAAPPQASVAGQLRLPFRLIGAFSVLGRKFRGAVASRGRPQGARSAPPEADNAGAAQKSHK